MENQLVKQNNPLAVMPVMDVQAAAQRRKDIVDFTKTIMVKDTDYGVVPGTRGKPTLYKPGAEKLTTFFGLSPRFEVLEKELDWTGDEHGGESFFYFQYRCSLYRGDVLVGQGVGSCNSFEKKYRYRNVPEWEATDEEKENAMAITQKRSSRGPFKLYKVPNPDPADLVNTIDKMSQKRALVAATLIAVNASEFFTQDLEDLNFDDVIEGEYTESEKPAPKPKRQPKRNGDKPKAKSGSDWPDDVPDSLAEYAHWFAEKHPYYKNNYQVVGALKKKWPDVGVTFKQRKPGDYETYLEEYANTKADEEAESA